MAILASTRGTTAAKRDIHQAVSDRIIASIEAGTAPWMKPWAISLRKCAGIRLWGQKILRGGLIDQCMFHCQSRKMKITTPLSWVAGFSVVIRAIRSDWASSVSGT